MSATVRVSYSDLAWALRAVLPHACRDRTLPSLAGVRLEADGGWLYAAATDRYTLGVARAAITDGQDVAAGAVIDRGDAEEIARRIKRRGLARETGDAELCFYPDGEIAFDWRARYEGVPGPFPDWRQVISRGLRSRPGLPQWFGYNTAFVARFAAAQQDGQPLTLMPVRLNGKADGAPMLMALGENFAGAVMSARMGVPGRCGGAADVLKAWRRAVPVPGAAS